MKIVLLGWGSLLWDEREEFDKQHAKWEPDGPMLKVEFCRVSQTRSDALTLVLDAKYGAPCKVRYALSRRQTIDDAICDLRCREGTTSRNIGFYLADGSRKYMCNADLKKTIREWATKNQFDAVIWTNLASNFEEKSKFSSSKNPFRQA